jgi:drug/metabolite transporter (DMT)-like permease
MTDHLKGLLITTCGVLLVVPDSLFVRLIVAEPTVIVFWRGLIAGLLVTAAVLAFQGLSGFRAVLRTGWPGVIYTLLLGSTAPGFVMAVAHTSVANVVFILASMPIFAAVFSRVFLGETITSRMLWTIAAVLAGLGIIAYGSGENDLASWKGDLWALYTSASFAAALTAVRRLRETSMIPAVPVAYFLAALMMSAISDPLASFAPQWPLFLAHGAIIGASSCLLVLGPRYLSSAEVALLILLESVLAPLLVWAVVGEDPGIWAIFGGAVVIGALLVSNLIALRRRRRVLVTR